MRQLAAVCGPGALVVVAVVSAAAGGQQPAASFRAGVDLITVEAAVLDAEGRPVRDLSPGDFSVTIGGRPRKVVLVESHGDQGPTRAVGVAGATRPAEDGDARADGRIVVFVVDRDSLAPGNEAALLDTASTVIDTLNPGDAVGLLGIPVGAVDLTREHDRVRAALPLMTGTRPRHVTYRDRHISWDEALAYERRDPRVIAQVVERECYSIPFDPGGLQNRCPPDLVLQAAELLQVGRAHVQTTTSALERLASELAPLDGSKHVILISGGLQFGQDLIPRFEQFARKAAEAQVVLHVVHLDQPDSDVTDRRTIASMFGGRDTTAGLGALTGMTGGAFFMGVGRASGIFERIATEINNFYVLGVESEPGDDPATPQALGVAVGRPGLTVRSRREVLPRARSGAAAAADPLAALLAQPTDLRELPLTAGAYSTRGNDVATLRVLIASEIGPARTRLPVDWGFSVLDAGNVVSTGRERLDAGAGEPPALAISAKLLPGRYRLRVAARDADGRAGVVDVPLVVGLRVAGDLQMSDLIVGVADGGRLQPRTRLAQGTPLSALIELMSADVDRLQTARAVLEVIPAGAAEPVRRFLMAARSGSSATIAVNGAEVETAALPVGRYTASVIAMVGEAPVGRVSRVFEIVAAR